MRDGGPAELSFEHTAEAAGGKDSDASSERLRMMPGKKQGSGGGWARKAGTENNKKTPAA